MVLHENLKTPLYAAFFCAVLNACITAGPAPEALTGQCRDRTVPIAVVQGDGAKSPMQGQLVTIRGVVTLIQEGWGLYIEEPGSDTDQRTSNAIFIQSGDLPGGIGPGVMVSAQGKVAETGDDRDPLTALTGLTEIIACSSGNELPLTRVSLPLNGFAREALEGMRIGFNDTLVVTDVYQFEQGKFSLSSIGFQYVPTEVMAPGSDTAGFIASNKASALPVLLPESTGSPVLIVSGTPLEQVSGVMAHDSRGKRLSLQSFSPLPKPGVTVPAPAKQGTLRIAGMNLHNYFNGDGTGLGFPTERGAETLAEFQQQRSRIGAAIGALGPHLLAVMELENDGFGPESAAQDFIRLAEEASQGTWAVTRPLDDNTGSDKITVGMFYRSDRLRAVGPAQTLAGAEFERSRQPQAQLFQQLPEGESLLIVINHLKSKGSCPDTGEDADQKDGQGCWNPMRRVSAEKMAAWANELAESYGTGNILILGDMNAYRNEDPITAIRNAGFTELMDGSQPTYSFAYSGQHGTLDYAFASDALLEQVQQAYIWHVNAAFPTRVELPQPWLGFSDHDPVIVELSLRHSSTSD